MTAEFLLGLVKPRVLHLLKRRDEILDTKYEIVTAQNMGREDFSALEKLNSELLKIETELDAFRK